MSATPMLPMYMAPQVPTTPRMRRFGNPTTLGLSAFATTTLVLSIFNTGIPSHGAEAAVLGMALFYGGFVQMIAGVWELIVDNTFGGTAFLSYGAFWMSFAYFVNFLESTIEATHVDEAVAIFLLSWTVFTSVMLIGALRTNVGLLMVFTLLEVTFILLTAGNFLHLDVMIHIAGWFGIATSIAAYYVGAAELYKETWKVDLLPVGQLNWKSDAHGPHGHFTDSTEGC